MFTYYPPDIKVLAVKYVLEGLSFRKIRRRLNRNISRQSFHRWVRLFHETRAVIRDPATYECRGRGRKLDGNDQEFMLELVEAEPGLFLDEIREKLYDGTGALVSLQTIQNELRQRLQLTLKKANTSNVRKNLLEKVKYISEMENVPPEYLVFTGECDRFSF